MAVEPSTRTNKSTTASLLRLQYLVVAALAVCAWAFVVCLRAFRFTNLYGDVNSLKFAREQWKHVTMHKCYCLAYHAALTHAIPQSPKADPMHNCPSIQGYRDTGFSTLQSSCTMHPYRVAYWAAWKDAQGGDMFCMACDILLMSGMHTAGAMQECPGL